MALLSVTDIEKLYGAEKVLDGVSFQLERHEHAALVGANGSGKSTLLKIIAGLEPDDGGTASLARNAIVTYVSQHVRFQSTHTLWEAMLDTFKAAREAQEQMRDLEKRMGSEAESDAVQAEYRRLSAIAEHGEYDYEFKIEKVLTGLELSRELWEQPVANLSGGQKTRANLARALLKESDLLLLDEPTNHLDIDAIQWLEAYLKSQRRAYIIVAHDRYFLESVSRRTLELVSGRVDDYPASYLTFIKLREERRAGQRRGFERQQEQIATTEAFIQRYGAGQRSKEAKGRQKRLDRVVRVERPEDEKQLRLRMTASRRKGDVALRLDHLAVGYSGAVLVHCPDELIVRHGARVAIVGPNGAGKTTLARTLVGRLEAVHGEYAWAKGETPGYYAQATTAVFAKGQSVLEAFLSRHNVGAETGRTYLGQFLFAGDDVEKLVDDLSGGERSRLALAALLYSHPNVMLLDEPTNHLDITAREALEAALAAFAGTLVLISHDRFLIDRLATEIWAIEDGRLAVYEGNWSDYDAGRGRRALSYSEREQVRAQPSTLSRAPAEISAELERMQAETVPVLTRLVALAPSAPVDQLEQLVAAYEEIQTRVVAATTEFLSD